MAFLNSDPQTSAYGIDLRFPLALSPLGDLTTVSGLPNLMQALGIRAGINLGEVLGQPLDGVDWDSFHGGPNDDITNTMLKARLLDQYQSREDRLTDVAITMTTLSSGETDVAISATGIDGQSGETHI